MKRSPAVLKAALLVLAAALLPVVLAAYAGWLLALHSTQQRLDEIAQLVSARTHATLDQAAEALKSVAKRPVAPCSEEGIDHMRLVAVNTFSVKSVGYVEEDIFACGSLGLMGKKVEPWVEDFITQDGVKVSLNATAALATAKPMLGLQYAAFNVLVDSEQFLEVILDGRFGMAVGTQDGRLLNASSQGVGGLLAVVHTGPSTGMSEGFLYTVVRDQNWVSIAAISRHEVWTIVARHQLFTLPMGILIAALLVMRLVRGERRRSSPLAGLERAVRNREFVVHYQPIIDLASNRCIGAEALVRWVRPDGSMVRPDLFIPLAEESGLIQPITDQVIEAVMRELGPMLAADRNLHVAINLAAADVSSGRFLPVLDRFMTAADVQPSQVWLEATERGFMNLDLAKQTINKARALGHLAAVDDFGTGYSSLQYLQQLPLDALKIDKAFVSSIGLDATVTPLIGHVIDMARTLKLFLVAEGVETVEQLAYLQARQVRYAQGWLFAKALPINDFKQYCQQEGAGLLLAPPLTTGL